MRPPASKWQSTFGYYALFACFGLSIGILGPTIPSLARGTGVSVAMMGVIFLVGSIGYTAGTLLGGRLYDRVPGHALLGVAELAAAACLALVPVIPSLSFLLPVVFCRGIAEGLVNTGGNTLLLWTHGEKASPFMNGLHFFFGLGAFVSPLLVARFTSTPDGWRWAYWIIAAATGLAGLWLLSMGASPDRRAHRHHSDERGTHQGPGAWGPIAVAALFLFAYVGVEISFGSWVYTYAVNLRVASTAGAAYLTSAFWLSFTIGRAASIPVALRFTPRQVIPAAIAACLVLAAALVARPPSTPLLWTVAIGLGFFLAPLWPSGYTLAGQVVTMTAFASGLVLLGDSFGAMVLPSLTGKIMDAVGPRLLSLSLPTLVLVNLTVCLGAYLSLLITARRRERASGTGRSDNARPGAGTGS